MKLTLLLIPLLVLSLSTVILQDSFAQITESTDYRSYDIVRNMQNGTEYINSDTRQYVYESTYPRIMIDNEWKEHRHEITDDIVKFESFIGSMVYDKNSCSYTLYKNEVITSDSEAVLPSVSWIGRTAPMNTDNWVNLDDLNNLPCVVEVKQTDSGIKITATKELLGESHDVLIKEYRDGSLPIYESTQTTEVVDGVTVNLIDGEFITTANGADWWTKHYYVDIETITTNTLLKSEQVIDLNYKKGIKESFIIYNYDPNYDFDKFTGTQTVHTNNILKIGDNSFNIDELDGSNFNKAWVLENQAEIFEIADDLKYDFSVSISQLYNIGITYDEVLGGKISMDFGDINEITQVGTVMIIDPTTTYGGNNHTNLGTIGAGIEITATVKGGQGGGGAYSNAGNSNLPVQQGGQGGVVTAVWDSNGSADIEVDVGQGGTCTHGFTCSGSNGSGYAGGANNGAGKGGSGSGSGNAGGSGGGYSAISGDGEGRFIIAGGGGGVGRNISSGGGAGGSNTGGNGGGGGVGAVAGGGGTQSAGGSAGDNGATAGGSLYGGNRGCTNANDCGGGGGSGYYGGGGGGQGGVNLSGYPVGCGCLGAGGGGGSSYVKTSYLTSVSTNTQGGNSSGDHDSQDGQIVISYTIPDPPAVIDDLAISTQSVANQLTLTWTNDDTGNTDGTQPTGYKIERSVDNSSYTTIVPDTSSVATTYDNGSLSPNQIYYYKVTAIGMGGEATSASNVVSTTTWNVPAQVGTVTGTSGTNPSLSWSAPSSDATLTNYKIYRQGSLHDTISASSTTYADSTNVSSGSTYAYTVSAVSSVGEGAQSASVNVVAGVPPNPPTGITASITNTATAPLVVTVSFSPSATVGTGTVSGFQLLRDNVAVTTGGLVTSLQDTAPSGGTTYAYTVKAISNHGTSVASASSSVTTPNTPAQVTGLTVTPVSVSRIDLSWNTPNANNSLISGYKVQISSNGGSSYSDVLTGNVNTVYQALSLNGNAQYHFKVSAINGVGTGTASDVKNTYTMTTTPASLSATPVSEVQINLAWGASTGATGYKIEFESPLNDGFSTLVNNTGTTDVTYSASGLTTGTQYNFKVSGWNNGGTSVASPEASAYTWGILQAPVIDSVSRLSSTSLQVDWTTGTGLPVATGYKIERQLGTGWTILANNTGTTDVTYTDSTLSSDQSATYRLYAINTIGTSPVSNEVSSEVISSGGGSSGGGGGSSGTAISSQTGITGLVDLTYIDQIHRVVLGQLLSKSINVAWDSSNNLEVKSIVVSDSPFRIVFQEVPFVLLGDPSGISNGKINYSVQIPNEICNAQGQINCVEQRQYDVPVEIQSVHKGSTLTKTSVIKIDLTSSSDIPLVFVLLAIVAVPVAFIIRKVGSGKSRRKASGSSHKSSKNGSNSKKVSL